MKELSIEQKAQRYDEAIERYRAKQEYESQKVREFMEYIFPELVESENEKIRKELISLFQDCIDGVNHRYTVSDCRRWLAWLEKQVPVDEDEIVKGIRRGVAISLMNHIDANSKGMCLSNMECEDIENAIVNEDWDKVYGYMKKKLEKQGEQPADKVEPIIVRDFNSAFSREQVEEIDRRIEESQRMYNAKLRDAMLKVKDFPMTN